MVRDVYRKPTIWEVATMLLIIQAIESASGISSKDFASKSRIHIYSRCRVIFGYNCRFYGVPGVVASQIIDRNHSLITTYMDYYKRDYATNYKGFKDLADKVRSILEQESINKPKKVNKYGFYNNH